MLPKTIGIVFMLGLILRTPYALATPPAEIKLEYRATDEKLHIEMAHVSGNVEKHYIHKIEVYKNDELPVVSYYNRQTIPITFVADIAIKAHPGDKLRVKASCIEGGSNEASIVVPEATEETGKSKGLKQERTAPPAPLKTNSGYGSGY